jgi:glucose/arabinose dehydrogenase
MENGFPIGAFSLLCGFHNFSPGIDSGTNGKATGEYEDFLTGFVTADGQVWCRPVGVAVGHDGALYVTDDGSHSVWRVSYTGK